MLNSELQVGLQKQGITELTEVQKLCYEPFINKQDIIVQSYTGSGKTLAFLLPLFSQIAKDSSTVSIILAPTHELAHQIAEQARLLSANSGIKAKATILMGDMNIDKQIERLRTNPNIIVGSPGRILDLIAKKKLDTTNIHSIVLDEADNLLTSSLRGAVKKLLHNLNADIQIALFSASMNEEAINEASTFLKSPVTIKTNDLKPNPNIKHYYVMSDVKDRFDNLKKVLTITTPARSLVFVNQHTNTDELKAKLEYHNFKAATLSSKFGKEDRKKALASLKKGEINILITSDLSARGLDIEDVTHVIHFDCPHAASDYLHRSGRTARKGKSGYSISILTTKNVGIVGLLKRTYDIDVHEIKPVKSQIKDVTDNCFIDISSKITIAETGKKSKNKYPKGYKKPGSEANNKSSKKADKKLVEPQSNNSSKKASDKTANKDSAKQAKKKTNDNKDTSTRKFTLNRETMKTTPKKKSLDEMLSSGSLSDALSLIEQFDDNFNE